MSNATASANDAPKYKSKFSGQGSFKPKSFERILVANRGEVAIRIFRAATELGLQTVGIYSEEDRLSLHRYKADEAWRVGQAGDPLGAYLDMDAILAIAIDRKADAIHPGYGFLSESAEFAQRCHDAGIVFIGPPASAIAALGDKLSARKLAVAAGAAVIPGTPTAVDVEGALAFANEIGYPVMLKAAFGGGGRGMRVARDDAQLREGYAAAQREATTAFGRGDIFVEKLVERPRHIEVQILADQAGHAVHLFERDCSVQRRHQKVVEVAPAVWLHDEVRSAMFDAALKVTKEAGLYNAATCEFLLGEDNAFYFIEVNPRLQVEHTITEMITGVDIVHAQIRIAEGHLLSDDVIGISNQASVVRRGAAIQARLTTEDPANNFAPDTGRVTAYRSAAGMGIRLDVGIAGAGAVITPHYDSLLVKITGFGLTHEIAAQKLDRSLVEFRVRGVKTNKQFLENIIRHPAFLKGGVDTGFVERTDDLYQFPRRRNRATRVLHALGDGIVNGPPGVEQRFTKPDILVTPRLPARLLREKMTTNYKALLDKKGPQAVAQAVRDQSRLLITDTTFRDAHQSLLATRVRTTDMLNVARATEDRLPGAFSIECWGGATFDVAFRFLREDPWERLASLRQAMPGSLLQMLLRGSNAVGYTNYPQNVIERFVALAANTGVDVFRIFDCFNQLEAMATSIEAVREAGKIAEVSICYTGNLDDADRPLYNLDYYKRKVDEVQAAGAHMIAIKDMAGLLRPAAATTLFTALRGCTDLPLHLHTHDTAGNGVATYLAAANAGADIVDCAIASMSGLTSQPSLDAVVAALAESERAPQLDSQELQELSDYWEAVRITYAPYESGLRASTADVYRHEIPGGQYSNLKPQAFAVGLADQWAEVRERYREVNEAFGDLIKVTPSSKVVGDFALWLVRNELTVAQLMASDKAYDFPQSVIAFFEGAIGVPEAGFPSQIRARILGPDAGPAPEHFASASLADYDFDAAAKDLGKLYDGPITPTLQVSYALYPAVIRDYLAFRTSHGDVSVLDTETFLYGLAPDREILVDLEPGKTLVVRRTAVSDLRADNHKEVHFNLNGQPRSVVVEDKSANQDGPKRRKADPTDDNQIGAPMPGTVQQVFAAVGDIVQEGDALCVAEAMKLETTVRAPNAGTISEVLAVAADRVEAGDLLFVIQAP